MHQWLVEMCTKKLPNDTVAFFPWKDLWPWPNVMDHEQIV